MQQIYFELNQCNDENFGGLQGFSDFAQKLVTKINMKCISINLQACEIGFNFSRDYYYDQRAFFCNNLYEKWYAQSNRRSVVE